IPTLHSPALSMSPSRSRLSHPPALRSFLHDALPISKLCAGVKLSSVKKISCGHPSRILWLNFKQAQRRAIAAGHDHSIAVGFNRSEEHTSELQSRGHVVCRLLLEKKKPAKDATRRGG